MKERITMFITYIEFFHKLHTKYLKRFSNKIQLIYTDINNDIKFDETLEINSSSNSSKDGNNVKIINQYNVESDNETSKSNKSDKILPRKNSLNELSDSSISSKSDSSISTKSDSNNTKTITNINGNYIYENILIRKNDSNNSVNKLDENDGIDLDKSVSDEEMNELFLNIESSCDSIINKNNENHDVEVINTQLTEENINKIDINDNPDNIEFKIEEKEEIQKEKKEEKEEIQKEEKEECTDEIKEESSVIESEPEPDTKKKRTYKPRKKKV